MDARSTTVAFESIDGPPESVFRKLVQVLGEEAASRQVTVVSREAAAQYRIRGYVAAHVQSKRVTIAWVWDVYDANQDRAMRITGEVPGSASERNAWAAADDQVIGRMARDGMDRLSAFLVSPPGPPNAPTPPGGVMAFAPASPSALSYAPKP